jgi:hypothetical protein
MAAAVELTDLSGSFGSVGSVSGFDHSALDARQATWHTHMFPFKLGGYRKRLITAPRAIATLHYTAANVPGSIAQAEAVVSAPVVQDGRCDCVVMWVDYDLSPGVFGTTIPCAQPSPVFEDILRQWDNGDFPNHLKTSIKFFPEPIAVERGRATLTANVSMEEGESDFKYSFNILHN